MGTPQGKTFAGMLVNLAWARTRLERLCRRVDLWGVRWFEGCLTTFLDRIPLCLLHNHVRTKSTFLIGGTGQTYTPSYPSEPQLQCCCCFSYRHCGTPQIQLPAARAIALTRATMRSVPRTR